jgi:hypothetical protein
LSAHGCGTSDKLFKDLTAAQATFICDGVVNISASEPSANVAFLAHS